MSVYPRRVRTPLSLSSSWIFFHFPLIIGFLVSFYPIIIQCNFVIFRFCLGHAKENRPRSHTNTVKLHLKSQTPRVLHIAPNTDALFKVIEQKLTKLLYHSPSHSYCTNFEFIKLLHSGLHQNITHPPPLTYTHTYTLHLLQVSSLIVGPNKFMFLQLTVWKPSA